MVGILASTVEASDELYANALKSLEKEFEGGPAQALETYQKAVGKATAEAKSRPQPTPKGYYIDPSAGARAAGFAR